MSDSGHANLLVGGHGILETTGQHRVLNFGAAFGS